MDMRDIASSKVYTRVSRPLTVIGRLSRLTWMIIVGRYLLMTCFFHVVFGCTGIG